MMACIPLNGVLSGSHVSGISADRAQEGVRLRPLAGRGGIDAWVLFCLPAPKAGVDLDYDKTALVGDDNYRQAGAGISEMSRRSRGVSVGGGQHRLAVPRFGCRQSQIFDIAKISGEFVGKRTIRSREEQQKEGRQKARKERKETADGFDVPGTATTLGGRGAEVPAEPVPRQAQRDRIVPSVDT